MTEIPGLVGRQNPNVKHAEKVSVDESRMREIDSPKRSSETTDVVELRKDVEKALSTSSEFDAAKVERLKSAIANGEYPVDLKRLAKEFVDLEKLI